MPHYSKITDLIANSDYNRGYIDGFKDGKQEYAIWKLKYDELKAEHAALKSCVQGLVDASEKVNLFLMEQSEYPEYPNVRRRASRLSAYVDKALQSWNQVKGGEANG